MALFRLVYQSFWDDPKVCDDFTPEDKYFFLYLLTNIHTNLCGCYEISIKQISREIGYNEETIQRLISRMENQHHVIRYDQTTKEILILNWHKYNWNKSEKTMKGVNEFAKRVKTPSFLKYLREVSEKYGYHIDAPCIDEVYPIDTTIAITNTITNSITDTDTNTIKEKKTKFSEFAGDDSELLKALNEFAAMRKQIKKPLTQGAVDRLLKNLSKFSREEWIPILNQSTDHCWQDIYALKTAPAPAGNAVGRTGQMLQDSYRMMEEWANG